MAADEPSARLNTADPASQRFDSTKQSLTLHSEKLEVSRRQIETAVVRVISTTRSREQLVEEELSHERVEVERVAVGRTVDSVPPVRQEGDTTILSVVEEVVVVERRLVLKEEVHFRRVKTTEQHRETVTLREQDATVTRTALEPKPSAGASTSDSLSSNLASNKDQIR